MAQSTNTDGDPTSTEPTSELRREVEAFCRELKAFCEDSGFEIAGTCGSEGIYGEITVHKVGTEGDGENYWREWKENKFNFCYHDGSTVWGRAITPKDLEEAVWFKTPEWVACNIGNVRLCCFPDGHCSVSENQVSILALFVSLEAAVSWSPDWDAAERAFKARNPPTGKGYNYLPIRGD